MIDPNMLAAASGSQTVTGAMGGEEVAELRKAMEAGYGTDVAALTGVGALRIQSLDKTMKATIQENKHFALFNELVKNNATATVDEWTEQSGVGGFLGGSTNTETGTINGAQGQYNRRVGLVKYLMTRREVSFVATLQNSIVEAEAQEQQNGALQLLTDAEFLCFEGDSSVVPTEYDGIEALIGSLDSADHVIDMAAGSLDGIDPLSKAAATIAGFGNFGTPTHLFMSQLTQSDLDTHLDPAFRVSLTGQAQDITYGAPVSAINTSWGKIKAVNDVFIRDEVQKAPFEVLYPAYAVANAAIKPAAVAAVAAAGDANSKWGAGHAGNYFYAVAGVSAAGQSEAVIIADAVAVAQGGKVTITITKSAGGTETGYALYRGRKNGSGAIEDLRLMCRIPKTGNQTVWVDNNRKIPGTTRAFMLNMSAGAQAINWRQMLPMTKFALYPTANAVIPWAQLLFGYLRITKRRHHVVFENIVPNGAVWKPFG